MNKKYIFVITRRQFAKNKGVGTFGNEKCISLAELSKLKKFWLDVLIKEEYINPFLSLYIGKEINTSYDPNVLISDDLSKNRLAKFLNIEKISKKQKTITAKYIKLWEPKPSLVESLLEILNDKIKKEDRFEKDYLLNLRKLNDNIFIYHHWLDKQGFSSTNRKNFLLSLREDVLDWFLRENKLVSSVDIEVNWLIHDTDLGYSGGDGMIFFEHKIINENNPDFVENCDLYDKQSKKVLKEFENDNFWIFTHTAGTDGFFDRIIRITTEPTFLKDASELRKYLNCDIEKLKYKAKVLSLLFISHGDTQLKISDPLINSFIQEYNRGILSNHILEGAQIIDTNSLYKAVKNLNGGL